MPKFELRLSTRFEELDEEFAHVVYSGPIDRFFHYEFGRLGYRTLDFEVFRAKGDFQGTAVLNYCDESTPFTRITEHKYFAPWELERFEATICYREFSRLCEPNDIPYYPIRQVDENAMLRKYVERAQATSGVSFVGRLGSYRYLDMDVTIGEALAAADVMLGQIRDGRQNPRIFCDALIGRDRARSVPADLPDGNWRSRRARTTGRREVSSHGSFRGPKRVAPSVANSIHRLGEKRLKTGLRLADLDHRHP